MNKHSTERERCVCFLGGKGNKMLATNASSSTGNVLVVVYL